MTEPKPTTDRLLWFLQERAKELNCLYRVEEILKNNDRPLEVVCRELIQAIPPGWQYPGVCRARIVLENETYEADDYKDGPWVQSADIRAFGQAIGRISVAYIEAMPGDFSGPFLTEEAKLVGTIAELLGNFVAYQRMRHVVQEYRTAEHDLTERIKPEWRVVLDLLRQTDWSLHQRICRKMLNHLCWNGVEDAKRLLPQYDALPAGEDAETIDGDANQPFKKQMPLTLSDDLNRKIFEVAATEMSDREVLELIEKWVQQDKLGFLIKVLVNLNSNMSEVTDAIRRYKGMVPDGIEIPPPIRSNALASLIRRFFSEDLDFIRVAKKHIDLEDIFALLRDVICLPESHGKLGGKSAGLFLAAHVLKTAGREGDGARSVRVPRTWYIASDVLMDFIDHNNFEEVVEQKYKDISRARLEYPNIVQSFKNAHFPPDIVKALSVVLDDLADCPIIVRSSSLLEDRTGAAFSGKYKSLFLANQGTKERRLEALLDAIAEVYASTFSPDPIEYRAERGLLDFHEEMGIMIQQVVGTRLGSYFLPAFAGVAFSRTEFRWSPRIQRSDGLVRLVPGLGTRAVDRTGDDFPVLMSPGQPRLRVNVSPDEMLRYSPQSLDVINLETNSFETVSVAELLRRHGEEYPGLDLMLSVREGDRMKPIGLSGVPADPRNVVVTFEGLIERTDFVPRMQWILKTLEETLGTPVDVEFASDGRDFYLLQCRSLAASDDSTPAPIPQDIPPERLVFSASRHVSNGRVPDITHIVYVDPARYARIPDRPMLHAVARAVGLLNMRLPKRQFILMGPGRWGSRGDLKLGVNVSYSEINNTAMLIEIARKSGHYVPDPSFGTHFFQDLVEARIHYLPLYPDDPGVVFNESFLRGSNSVFARVVPEHADLADVIRVIDVRGVSGGRVLHVLLNADLDRAVGLLAPPRTGPDRSETRKAPGEPVNDTYWRWRFRMVERLGAHLDPGRFGVRGLYVFGSTKNATAGPNSDIDLLVHFDGTPEQRRQLDVWLEGWSLTLAEMNYFQTGYRSEGLLDVHVITDEDIARKESFAIKIGAITDAARPVPMKKT